MTALAGSSEEPPGGPGARARWGAAGAHAPANEPAVPRAAGAVVGAPPAAAGEPPLRGEAVWRRADAAFGRLDAWVERLVPPDMNPLTQTGAIANTTLLASIVSGVVLLIWYTPSVHQAHASIEAMAAAPWTAGLVRSLHRYASDACMAFVLLHALRLLAARRLAGPRWVAWVTGLVLLALLWLVGWLGYWLVWDERAQLVALGTGRLLDGLPIFSDPLSRSFLTDGSVNSLLFFVVFFLHMLLPLAMGVALWLHLTRLSRPRFLTGRAMTAWVLGALLAASLVHPATSAAPAAMTATPGRLTIDAWYLAGLALTDRLGAGALWALVLGGGALASSLPWALARAPAVGPAPAATVDEAKCNACALCARDCPFDAITLAPRPAGGRADVPRVAVVDPARCVACGICAGSCDPVAIGLPWLRTGQARRRVEGWLAAARPDEHLALVCGEVARLDVDPGTGACAALPGYRALEVPCAGWVHALSVERALRRGAAGVLVAACPAGSCRQREGTAWTQERLAGARAPALRLDKVDPARARVVEVPPGDLPALTRAAAALRAGGEAGPARPGGARAALGGALVAGALAAGVVLVSEAPYAPPALPQAELVVSFKHPGQVSEVSRPVTAAEREAMLPHMRRDAITERRRAAVRLRVTVDGAVALERAVPPAGLWGDGASVAIERLPLAPGMRRVEVAVGDGHDGQVWEHVSVDTFELTRGQRRVVLFDRLSGFSWH